MVPVRSEGALDLDLTAFVPPTSSPEICITYQCQESTTTSWSRRCKTSKKQGTINQCNDSKISPRKIIRERRKRLSQDVTIANLTEDLKASLTIHDSSNVAAEDMNDATAALLRFNLADTSLNTMIQIHEDHMSDAPRDLAAKEPLYHFQNGNGLVSQTPCMVAPIVSEPEIVHFPSPLSTHEPRLDSESENTPMHSSKSVNIYARVDDLQAQLQNRISPYGYRARVILSSDDVPRIEDAPALIPLIDDLWRDMVQAFLEGWSVGGVPTAPELIFESLVESAQIPVPDVEKVRAKPPPLPRRSKARCKAQAQPCSQATSERPSFSTASEPFPTCTRERPAPAGVHATEARILDRRNRRSMRGHCS